MRPEGAPEHVFGRVHGPASIQDLKAIDGDLERPESELPVGRPFRAIFLLGPEPRAEALGYFVKPLRGNRGIAASREKARWGTRPVGHGV
jgi:hypothetical protein